MIWSGQKEEGATPQEVQKLDLSSRLSHRGLLIVVDPIKKLYEYYRPGQFMYPEGMPFISILNPDGTVKRILHMPEYGKVWFVTKKDADAYCNRIIQGEKL